MKRPLSLSLAAALTFGLAGISLAAPALTSLTVDGSVTAEGTVGAALTITGSELGTKAPKAVLQLHGDATARPFALKLAKPFDGSTLHASVTKITPGVYDLVVTVKGSAPVTLQNAFTAQAPHIDSLGSSTIAPGDHLDILGRFFGSKRGKVTIGDVTAKVFGTWTDGKITVVVSKRNKSGSATIDIFGKGGTQDDGATANVVAPIAGSDHLSAQFDNGGPALNATSAKLLVAVDSVITSKLNGSKMFGSGLSTNTHTLDITLGGPLSVGTYTGGQVFVLYNEVGVQLRNYTSQNAAPWTVVITQRVGSRVEGTFSGGVSRTVGNGPASYSITGDFTMTVK